MDIFPSLYRYLLFSGVLALLAFSSLSSQAQCGGGYGAPIFNETFGTGTTAGPPLTVDHGLGTDYSTGATGYTYQDPTAAVVQDNFYTVVTSPQIGHSDWVNIHDHTGNTNGKMLLVNAAYAPNIFYKRKVTGLCFNTNFLFSSWFVEVNGPASFGICGTPLPSNVRFEVQDSLGNILDSTRTGTIKALNNANPPWINFTFSFNTGLYSTVYVVLRNIAPGGCGNDLAIDDITLRACGPTINFIAPAGKVCLNNSISFTATPGAGYSPPYFQWQLSTDNGVTWGNISGATSSVYSIAKVQMFQNNYQFRCLIAGSQLNVNSTSCSVPSPVATLVIQTQPVKFNQPPAVCQNSGLFNLVPYGVPAGGLFSGTGTTGTNGSSFDPTKGVLGTANKLYYTFQNASTGCTSTDSTTINILSSPVTKITANGATNMCAGAQVQLTIVGTGTIQWYKNNVAISGATGSVYYASTSGTYKVIQKNSFGCSTADSIPVVIFPVPTLFLNGGNSSGCVGTPSTLSTAVVAKSYKWTFSHKYTLSSKTNSITTSTGGTYTLTIVDANNCIDSADYHLTMNGIPVPVVQYSLDSVICKGATTSFGVNNGFSSYQWFRSPTGVAGSFTAISGATATFYTVSTSGWYFITVTNGSGCPGSSAPHQVTVVAPPAKAHITATSGMPVCYPGTVTISTTAVAGLTYQWQINGSAQPNSNSPSFTGLYSGLYTVIARNSTGCFTVSDSVLVTINPKPTASTPSGVLHTCGGTATTLSAFVQAGYTFQWYLNGAVDAGHIKDTLKTNTSGSYYYIVTNATGCKDTSQAVIVTIAPLVVPVIQVDGASVVCSPGTATMEVTASFPSYQWYENGNPILNGTNRVIQVSTLGTNQYTVRIVDANGCSDLSAAKAITVNPMPNPVIQNATTTTFCAGGSVQLNIVNPFFSSFVWQLNGTIIQGVSGTSYTATIGGSYTVTVVNSNGCTGTSLPMVVTVNPLPNPVLYASGPAVFCAGKSSSFVLHARNWIVGGTYTWVQIDSTNATGLGVVVSSGVNDSIYSLAAAHAGGFYTVTLQSPSGCTGYSDTVYVSQYKPPVMNLGKQALCTGDFTTLYSPPGFNFAWTYSPDGVVAYTTAPGVNNLQSYKATVAGFYTVNLTDKPVGGCSGSAMIQVKTHPVLSMTISGASSSCPGVPAVLTGTITNSPFPSNPTYQWSFQPNSTGAYHKISGGVFNTVGVDSTGNYKLVVNNSNYCPDSAIYAYALVTTLKPVILKSATICVGTSVTLSNTGPALPVADTYQWYRNFVTVAAPAGTAPTLSVTTDGYYFMKVTDASGCKTISDTSYITTAPVPVPGIQITGPTVVCTGGVVKLYVPAQKGYTYQWSSAATLAGPYTSLPGMTDTLLNVTANTGFYRITEFNPAGCSGADQIYVVVDSVPHNILPATAQVCTGGSVTLAVTTSARLVWSYKNQTNIISTASSVLANLPGTYYLKIFNPSDARCYSLDSTKVTINPVPVASFNSHDSCRQSATMTFINNTTIATGPAPNYVWNYGDPATGALNTGTTVNGSHLYTGLGTYTVTLTATSASGCINSVSAPYRFKGTKPVAGYTISGNPAKLCGSQPVTLTDASTNQTGTIIHYRWDFFTAAGLPAAVNADTLSTVIVTFPDTAVIMTYRIRESVTAQSGCIDTSSQMVTVGASPVVSLILPQKVVCMSQLSDTLRGGLPLNGSGGTGVYTGVGVTNGIFNPKTATLGKHPIRYTFTSTTSGCIASATDTIQVVPAPGPTTILVPGAITPCTKSATLTAVNSSAANFIWLRNDTVIANATSSSYTVTASGKYTARALTSAGCARDTSVILSLGNGPKAKFVIGSVCQNLIINYFNQSVSGDNTALTYKWNFGDPASGANISTAQNPQHQYSTVGNALVSLIVYSASGCTDTLTKLIQVTTVDSAANFTITANRPYCMTEPLIFQDSSLLPGQIINKYTWNFYDATNKLVRTDSGAVVFETFTSASMSPVTYTVQEVLTTGVNCPVQSPIKTFTLNPVTPLTYVREAPLDMCNYAPGFTLTGGSTVPPGQAGHGAYTGAGVIDSAMFVPSKAPFGNDVVSYIFTNQYGCKSSASTQYVVHDTIPLASQRIVTMQGTVVTLNGIGSLPFTFGPDGISQISSDSLKWNWSPGTGLSATNVPNPTFTAADSITYTLTVTSPFGCTSKAVFTVLVNKLLHVPNTFTPNGDGTNDYWIIRGLELYPAVEVFVFNRWGQQLFYSKGYGHPWDGHYNGRPLPMGTYYYLIKLNGQSQKPLTGPLTILY